MKNPKWHFLPELPKVKEKDLQPKTIPVIVIDQNGDEIKANFVTFGGNHFYDLTDWAVQPKAWRYTNKQSKNKGKK